MIVFRGHFDGFNYPESTISHPVKDGNDLLITAKHLFTHNHPLSNFANVVSGTLRFINVVSSVREYWKYDGSGFKTPEVIDDGEFNLTENDVPAHEFELCGNIDDTHSRFEDWIIKAQSFEFECDGVYDMELKPTFRLYNYRTIEEAVKQASTG